MKMMRSCHLFVLFGVGFGMVASDIAAAQPFRPPVPGGGRSHRPARRRAAAGPEAPRAGRHHTPAGRSSVRPAAWSCAPRRWSSAPASSPGCSCRRSFSAGWWSVERLRLPRTATSHGYSRDSLVWQDSETLYRRGRLDGVHPRLQRPRREALVRGRRGQGPGGLGRSGLRERRGAGRRIPGAHAGAGDLPVAGFPGWPARGLRADGREGHRREAQLTLWLER